MAPTKTAPKVMYSFVIDPRVLKELRRITEREGIPTSEQIRRGIEMWLNKKARQER